MGGTELRAAAGRRRAGAPEPHGQEGASRSAPGLAQALLRRGSAPPRGPDPQHRGPRLRGARARAGGLAQPLGGPSGVTVRVTPVRGAAAEPQATARSPGQGRRAPAGAPPGPRRRATGRGAERRQHSCRAHWLSGGACALRCVGCGSPGTRGCAVTSALPRQLREPLRLPGPPALCRAPSLGTDPGLRESAA